MMREPKSQSRAAAPRSVAEALAAASESRGPPAPEWADVGHAPALPVNSALRAPMESSKSAVAQSPNRALRTGVAGLAARTALAANAPPQARLGRSPASVAAALHRAMSCVDVRLAMLVMQPAPKAAAPDDGARLELALLAHLHKSIASQAAQVQDDAVLVDSLAEFAESATATVNDLEAGGARALDRWLDFIREQVTAAAAMGYGETEPFKVSVRSLRQAMVPLRELHQAHASLPVEARAKLKGFRVKAIALFAAVAAAQQATSPRAHASYLDKITRT